MVYLIMKNFKLLPLVAILATSPAVVHAKTLGRGITDNGKVSEGAFITDADWNNFLHVDNLWRTTYAILGNNHKRFNINERSAELVKGDVDTLKNTVFNTLESLPNQVGDLSRLVTSNKLAATETFTSKLVTENLKKDVVRNEKDIEKIETSITGVNTDLREIRTDLRGLHRIEAGMDSFQDSIEDMQSDIDKIPALAKPDNVVTEGSGSELTLKRCPNTLEVTWDVCTYQVGDNGPAGGIVIFATEDGKHGQELSYKQPSSTFGCEGVAIPTEISDYPGAISTQTIANTNCEGGSLAEKALRYVTHVRYGWYIPSIGQLQSIHDHLEDIGLHIDEIYWSSTLVAENDEVSWGFDFMSNTPVQIKRSDSASVRFVRNF